MFSATVWDPILFTFAVKNFRHYDDKLHGILILTYLLTYSMEQSPS